MGAAARCAESGFFVVRASRPHGSRSLPYVRPRRPHHKNDDCFGNEKNRAAIIRRPVEMAVMAVMP